MATSTNLEYLKLKVFLYKYTPDFTLKESAEDQLFKIDRFKTTLSEQFFSKLDISEYVTGYTFDQTLSENTFSWTLNLQDSIIPFEKLNSIQIEGIKFSVPEAQTRLALYESIFADLSDLKPIFGAKVKRGVGQAPMVVRVGTDLPTITGFRLSDLIQPYDLISVFLYKAKTPLEEVVGNIKIDSSNGTYSFVADPTGSSLTASELQDENILLSPKPGDTTGLQTLFSNEFNGFVIRKNLTSRVGTVDSLSISGNGTTRLLGATRRVLKGSLLQKTIYDIGEIPNPLDAVPYQNSYVNKTIQEIFVDLLGIVNRIAFDYETIKGTINVGTNLGTTATLVQYQKQFSGINFFDISSLIVGNNLDLNQFSIPCYLLAKVMQQRGFNFREPFVGSEGDLVDIVNAEAFIDDPVSGRSFNQTAMETIINESEAQTVHKDRTNPVFFDPELNVLRPYFVVLQDVFTFFNAELSTPFEIIDEIKAKTFLEFFERYDGTIIVRSPQYNDNTNAIFSSTLDILDRSYSEGIENLVARQKVGYGTDIIGVLEPIQAFFYTNGKLLKQYGFLEAGVDTNPNVKNDVPATQESAQQRSAGWFRYATYFLNTHNAALKTGSISANLDPSVAVGRTFFDEVLNKFGYITKVTKAVQVGGTANMTFEMSYVRDCFVLGSETDGTQLQFPPLERLIDIAQAFSESPILVNQRPTPEPTH